jgi:membrane associated rhomboid family serine protease
MNPFVTAFLSTAVLVLTAPVALANGAPPGLNSQPTPLVAPPSAVAAAAVAGVAGAVAGGWWLIRRIKP